MGKKKVVICGLGAVGLTFANKFRDKCELKILANKERVDSYKLNPPMMNGEKVYLDYITPDESWNPDLIILSTKTNGLPSAIEYIKNFVGEDTIIISQLNGITSENRIAEVYGWDKVLHSYYIGHSAMREGNNVIQDGLAIIYFGSPYEFNKEKVLKLKNILDECSVDYNIPEDIIYSLWLKYTLNVFSNQVSTVLNLKFGEMHGKAFINLTKKIIKEVKAVAEKEGVNGLENLEKDALKFLDSMCDEGKTSMLQDILAGRKTEVDIFAGEIIRLGEKHGIATPYNQVLYDLIKVVEEVRTV